MACVQNMCTFGRILLRAPFPQTKKNRSQPYSGLLRFLLNRHGFNPKDGGDEGSRTPVRKHCHATFSERIRHTLFRSLIA